MKKRILPIYQTGWFYLIVIFLGWLYYAISSGYFNTVNQVNLDILNQVAGKNNTINKTNQLSEPDILTLYSSFDEQDVSIIADILSQQANSQIALIGVQSRAFINKLEKALSQKPLNNKVIIASDNILSAKPLSITSSLFISGILDWFRLTEKSNLYSVKSDYFTFSPFLLNTRQSYPLVWQQKDKIYLSLPGEILQGLTQKNELSLNDHWQLTLNNTKKSLVMEQLYLGFLGEVFTAGTPYDLNQNTPFYNTLVQKKLAPKKNIKQKQDTTKLTSLETFYQQYGTHKNAPSKLSYKVIIITANPFENNELIKPLLLKLTAADYIVQNFLTLLLTWLLIVISLVILWFIHQLAIKQQVIALVFYAFSLFLLQYLMYSQQQWLEILPMITLTVGLSGLMMAYQKEMKYLVITLDRDSKKIPASLLKRSTARKNTINKEKHDYKSPQNFSPKAVTQHLTSTVNTTPQKNLTKQSVEPELAKTVVITERPLKGNTTQSHHLTVDNFGRYQVEGILGKGAMGIVYQGVDPKINRHVAIKTLQLSDDVNSPESTEAKDRFFREAQTAGGLSHANIVTIYDVGEENNLGYIAMDLLTGAPLSLFTQEGQTLPIPLIYQLLVQITDALDYAHNQNVVHRDIKPANIIYDDDLFKVTVTDFGIAYVSDNSKTRTGIIMGSPYYMSPEQILGLKVDGRSDIFSLGVTFYQLLCGHLPFEGESIATVAYQITKAKPTPVNQHNTKLPASALRIVNKAMHKDIDKRYQSMAEFKLALINALKRDFKITAS